MLRSTSSAFGTSAAASLISGGRSCPTDRDRPHRCGVFRALHRIHAVYLSQFTSVTYGRASRKPMRSRPRSGRFCKSVLRESSLKSPWICSCRQMAAFGKGRNLDDTGEPTDARPDPPCRSMREAQLAEPSPSMHDVARGRTPLAAIKKR